MSNDDSFENAYLKQHLAWINSKNKGKLGPKYQRNYLAHLPKNKTASLLEIGPGYGDWLDYIYFDQGYRNVRAIDISEDVVSHCNQRIPDSTVLVSGALAYLRQSTEIFDVVFMSHVMEHIPKAEVIPLLRAIFDRLAPGGKLMIEVPNMANPLTAPYLRYGDFTHECGYTDTSLGYVLRCAGFPSITIFGTKTQLNNPLRILQIGFQYVVGRVLRLCTYPFLTTVSDIMSLSISAIAEKEMHNSTKSELDPA